MKPTDPLDQEILKHKAQGKANKEIAPEVNLSVEGVKYRLRRMFRMFNVKNSTALVNYAVRNNLL